MTPHAGPSSKGQYTNPAPVKREQLGETLQSSTHGEDSQPRTHTFRVVIIEPRMLTRDCLSRCLQSAIGPDSVTAFASLADWSNAAPCHLPGTVILLCMGRCRRIDEETERELSRLAQGGKLPPTVLLAEGEDAGDILKALDCGAKGYIPTSVSLDVAVKALSLVRAGGTYVPASSLNSARNGSASSMSGDMPRVERIFTARQVAVVRALRMGKSNKVIAHELNMQESTVKVHVRNIMKKLKATNRTQVAYLTRNLFPSRDIG